TVGTLQQAFLECAPHKRLDFRHSIWLRQKIVRAQFHGRHCGFDAAVARDDDDLGRQWSRTQLPQHFESVYVRHDDVEQGNIEWFAAKSSQRLATVTHHGHGKTTRRHELLEDSAEVCLILRNEYADGGRCCRGGARC